MAQHQLNIAYLGWQLGALGGISSAASAALGARGAARRPLGGVTSLAASFIIAESVSNSRMSRRCSSFGAQRASARALISAKYFCRQRIARRGARRSAAHQHGGVAGARRRPLLGIAAHLNARLSASSAHRRHHRGGGGISAA